MNTEFLRYLSASLYEPEEFLWEQRIFHKMAQWINNAEIKNLVIQLDTLSTTLSDNDKECILIDYTRLFIGAGKSLAAPYMSVWSNDEHPWDFEGYFRFLDQAEISLQDDLHDLPDHVCVLLETMMLLFSSGNSSDNEQGQRLLKEFFIPFALPWADALRSSAQTQYYALLGRLIYVWLCHLKEN